MGQETHFILICQSVTQKHIKHQRFICTEGWEFGVTEYARSFNSVCYAIWKCVLTSGFK